MARHSLEPNGNGMATNRERRQRPTAKSQPWHTDTQTHRHTDTQTHRHTDTQTHRHTGHSTYTQSTSCLSLSLSGMPCLRSSSLSSRQWLRETKGGTIASTGWQAGRRPRSTLLCRCVSERERRERRENREMNKRQKARVTKGGRIGSLCSFSRLLTATLSGQEIAVVAVCVMQSRVT